jgi:branched-chain amino acid transport system permease protein
MLPRTGHVAIALLVVGCTAAPLLITNESAVYYFSLVLIWSIFAIGYDLVFGVTGMLSLGHAAFFGAGAFVHAVLMMRAGWPFAASLFAAGLAGTVLAALFGLLTLRSTGVFLALTTQALAQLAYVLAATRLSAWTGGLDGLAGVPRPHIGDWDPFNPRVYYALLAGLFLLALAIAGLLRASPFGQVLLAIRQNTTRSLQLGFDARLFKLAAFAVSGCYSGIAGALLASLMSFVSPQIMQWTVSGDLLIMVLLGGAGTLLGPVLGVAFIELLREELSGVTEHWFGVLGLIFVLCTLFLPRGLAGLVPGRRSA